MIGTWCGKINASYKVEAVKIINNYVHYYIHDYIYEHAYDSEYRTIKVTEFEKTFRRVTKLEQVLK